ncbi:MAG: division/cell wall cluster transcriptional repressor MraZ [Clostridia bacterium]|nr:division/cell wall cluster transcriptional repressor MraZ [Clostridia bacterium]
MLVGSYKHNFDEKNRAAVPKKFCTSLGDSFIVTKGIDGCLFMMSYDEWNKLQENIRGLSFNESTILTRHFAGSAQDVTPDSQGRVCFGQTLTDFAGLSGQVMFVGATSRVEVWSVERWQEKQEAVTDAELIPLLEKIHF